MLGAVLGHRLMLDRVVDGEFVAVKVPLHAEAVPGMHFERDALFMPEVEAAVAAGGKFRLRYVAVRREGVEVVEEEFLGE